MTCHFGADWEALGHWAATQICLGCDNVNNCTEAMCVPPDRDLDCAHPVCFHRRTQLLLQHAPVDCSAGFTAVWNALHRQCAKVNDECCSHRDCPVPVARHCGLRFKAVDQYAASVYVGVATLAAVMALLRDDATTVAAISTKARYIF